MTTESAPELETMLTEIRSAWSEVKPLPATLKTLQDDHGQLRQHVTDLRRSSVLRSASGGGGSRRPGSVSDDCARAIAAQFITHCERSNKLEALCSLPSQRDALTSFAREHLNISTRAALTTTDVPLPVEYAGEIRELISQFGVVRPRMMPYPIGMAIGSLALTQSNLGLEPFFFASQTATVDTTVPLTVDLTGRMVDNTHAESITCEQLILHLE